MSEQLTQVKNYVLKKTTSDDVVFYLHPISNPGLTKLIVLTNKQPQVALPLDWALGVFFDDGVYSLYKGKNFTFNDNDSLVKEAVAAGVYFSDELDFTPSSEKDLTEIITVLKSGNRVSIIKAIEKFGNDRVKDVAIANVDNLTTGVVNMLESIFKVQLKLSED